MLEILGEGGHWSNDQQCRRGCKKRPNAPEKLVTWSALVMLWPVQPDGVKTPMSRVYLRVALLALSLSLPATSAFADIEKARDLMEASQFEEAMQELLPAARSGNADAEELIGVMYAMGLGVPRDDTRAFEW